MDEVDEAIVELLEVDGRLTHREIAARSVCPARRRRPGCSGSSAAARW